MRVLDRYAHKMEELEAARAELGEDSLSIQRSCSGPANVSGLGMCEGAQVWCWAVLQLPCLLHARKDTSVFLMNRERVDLVSRLQRVSLDPRFYINFLTC